MQAGRVCTSIAMLFLCAFAPAVGKAQVLNLSGVWEHQSVEALSERDYTVLYRYIVFQKKQKICGCLHRSGLGSDRIDQYSFRGIARSNHADIWLDSGSSADINYIPRYPFNHDEIVRLRLYRKQLIMGGSSRKSDDIRRLSSEENIDYDVSHPLSKAKIPATAETCDTVSEGNFKPFLAQCLNDDQ